MKKGPKCDDLEYPVSRSPQVKGNGGVGLPWYDFLLVPHTNYVPICDGLAAIEHESVGPKNRRPKFWSTEMNDINERHKFWSTTTT